MSVQVIERNGKPEWAVLPYQDYLRLVEQAEMLEDIQEFDRVKAALESGKEEIIPAEVVNALLEGDNPVRVWREFRGVTQKKLAEVTGISTPFLSQIETGQRKASTGVLARMAEALGVEMEDLLPVE